MNTQKRLMFGQAIFFLFTFVCFGLIIVNEKQNELSTKKVKKEIESHINKNYKNIKDEIEYKDIKHKNKTYSLKITSKNNKNLYFYIYYKNKKISDTYKKDYLEGRTLLNHIKENLTNEIKTKTNTTCKIQIPNTLNNYTQIIKDKIINEENLLELKFYIIEKELYITNWTSENINNEIIKFINNNIQNNITPKNYKIIVTNKNDIINSIQIDNLTNDFINNPNKIQIINDIIKDNNSILLQENKIKYKYLN